MFGDLPPRPTDNTSLKKPFFVQVEASYSAIYLLFASYVFGWHKVNAFDSYNTIYFIPMCVLYSGLYKNCQGNKEIKLDRDV